MDRQKYVNSCDYRDGYDEGVEDGKRQMMKTFEYVNYHLNEIKEILAAVRDMESEDTKNEDPQKPK